jgi:hypothetical protein
MVSIVADINALILPSHAMFLGMLRSHLVRVLSPMSSVPSWVLDNTMVDECEAELTMNRDFAFTTAEHLSSLSVLGAATVRLCIAKHHRHPA